MKKNLLSLASVSIMLIALFSACSKEDPIEKAAPSETVSAVKNLLAAGQGPYDVLGHGYNVTGEYGNDVSTGFAVIDVARFKQDQAARLIEESPRSQQYLEEYGENAFQYSKMMSRKIEATTGFSFFKSTVSNSFSSTNAFDAKYIYGSYNLTIKQKRYRFNATVDLLKNHLSATFLADLQSKSPQQLVQDYGTHVLVDVYTGAKMDIMFQAETNNQSRETAARAGVKIGVSDVFGLDINNSVDIKAASQNFSRKLSYRTRGGDPSRALIGEISLDQTAPKISIANWQSSSTPENSVFVDIGQYGLILLYDLISDPAKKAAIKSYIDQYLRDNQVNLGQDLTNIYRYKYDHRLVKGWGLTSVYWALDTQFEGYNKVGPAFKAYKYNMNLDGLVPIYKHYNPTKKVHTYKPLGTPESEWNVEDIAFYAFNKQVPGTVPVYQYEQSYTYVQSPSISWHYYFYSTNPNQAVENNLSYPYLVTTLNKHYVPFYAYPL